MVIFILGKPAEGADRLVCRDFTGMLLQYFKSYISACDLKMHSGNYKENKCSGAGLTYSHGL
jgi:hypothetical protein